MVMEPVVTTSDVGLPETIPYIPDEITATFATNHRSKIEKEVTAATRVKNGTKHNEHEGICRCNAQGQAKDAIRCKNGDFDEMLKPYFTVLKYTT